MVQKNMKGAIAAGHPLTAQAGAEILRVGGNAFDAIFAAHFAACVVEPVLASLGGGGFLLAQPATGAPRLYDFFVQTPIAKRASAELDFRPILADFGAVQQEFHIGLGSIATPGAVKGLFQIHRDLGSMPVQELLQPAIEYAQEGVVLNDLQAYIFEIVSPILLASAAAQDIFLEPDGEGVIKEGHLLILRELAATLDALAHEGDELFYHGEIGALILAQLANGGHLTAADLHNYEVKLRHPLQADYRGHRILTNPPPSSGGILINLALGLWDQATQVTDFGSVGHVMELVAVMQATNQARLDAHLDDPGGGEKSLVLLDPGLIARYAEQVRGHARAYRGTTHLSVIDQLGNIATMTVSNGEGCGEIVPGTGVMLNNMLGEEDLNPSGFHNWQADQRMTSMMVPTIINHKEGPLIALGSGGSNRIRTAILQTIINLLHFKMPLDTAITSPRVHFENNFLNLELGYDERVLARLAELKCEHKSWNDLNLFFGGVHAVHFDGSGFTGVGDPRRGGVAIAL